MYIFISTKKWSGFTEPAPTPMYCKINVCSIRSVLLQTVAVIFLGYAKGEQTYDEGVGGGWRVEGA